MDDFIHIETYPRADKSFTPIAEEATAQEIFHGFLDVHPFVRQTVVDKINGCIVGSALGDAVGLYTEFLNKSQSAQVYPARKFQLVDPVTELHHDSHRTRFEPCGWTDDTDQALLIILGYLHAHTNNPQGLTAEALSQDFASRLHIWISQGLLALDRPAFGIGALVGGTVQSENYLNDPVGTSTQRWVHSGRYQAPNGSLMRTHPVGVVGVTMSEEETMKLSAGIGRTTHVDPRCVVSCCIEVALIRGILRGEITNEQDLDTCIKRCYAWVKSQPNLMNPGGDEELTTYEIERHLEIKEFEKHVYATTLEELELDEQNKIGYVYKCLGSAIVLLRRAMRAESSAPGISESLAHESLFENLMVDLIMEGGDSDTNGAAAGAVLGAYLGYAKLPSHWTLGLAHKTWLIEKIRRLTAASGVIKVDVPVTADEAPDGGRGLRSEKELEQRWALLIADIARKSNAAREKQMKQRQKKKGIAGWFSV